MNIIYCALSIDGFIADPNGSVDWLDAFQSKEYAFDEFYQSIDSVVIGRKTYEQVLGFGEWPYANIPSFVVSSQTIEITTPNTFLCHQNISHALEKFKDRRVWLVGGCGLYSTCFEHNLVDEIILTTIPVVLGKGIALLDANIPTTRFTLAKTRNFTNSVSERHYKILR